MNVFSYIKRNYVYELFATELMWSTARNLASVNRLLCAGNSLGDARVTHAGQTFNTMDDDTPNRCAYVYKGAWWYKPAGCLRSHLTGIYLFGPVSKNMNAKGVVWYHFKGHGYSLKSAEMKIRPFYV